MAKKADDLKTDTHHIQLTSIEKKKKSLSIIFEDENTELLNYIEKHISIPGHGMFSTSFNAGGGNCFFHSVQQGLSKLGLPKLTIHKLRNALSDWFMDPNNQLTISLNGTRYPEDIIPNLPSVGIYVPNGGWREFLRIKNWDFWGKIIRNSGAWVGALELPGFNAVLNAAGVDACVNIFDARSNLIFGNEANEDKVVIMLYLRHGHIELLTPLL